MTSKLCDALLPELLPFKAQLPQVEAEKLENFFRLVISKSYAKGYADK